MADRDSIDLTRSYKSKNTAQSRQWSPLVRLFPSGRTGGYNISSQEVLQSAQETDGLIRLQGAYGLDLTFVATGSDGDTLDYRIYGVDFATDPYAEAGSEREPQYFFRRLGTGTLTFSTATGTGSTGIVRSTERFADGVTFTADNMGTHAQNITNADWRANTSTSNISGTLGVSDIGPFAWLYIDMDVDSSSVTEANVLVKLTS